MGSGNAICHEKETIFTQSSITTIASTVAVAYGFISALDCTKAGFSQQICTLGLKVSKKLGNKMVLIAKKELAEQLFDVLSEIKDKPKVVCLNEDMNGCYRWSLHNPLNIVGSVDLEEYRRKCIANGNMIDLYSEDNFSRIIFTCVEK